jgi:polyhydroxybutyrate depolymerase
LADVEAYGVLYPQAQQDDWGSRCWDMGYCRHDEDIDDPDFIRTLIELVREDQGLETVYLTGMSNGGDMTYRMACEASDLIAAAAPVTGCMMNWLQDTCAPGAPPPVMHIHGNNDRITLWDGDPSYYGGGYLGTLDSIGTFAGLHMADDYTTERVEDPSDGSAYIHHQWATADGAIPVQLYEIDRGGHDWPTGPPRYDLDSAALMWEFFRGVSR